MDNGIIGFTLQGMVTLFIEEEEGAEVEEGEIGWVRDLLKDIQLEDLEEVSSQGFGRGKWYRILFPRPIREKQEI